MEFFPAGTPMSKEAVHYLSLLHAGQTDVLIRATEGPENGALEKDCVVLGSTVLKGLDPSFPPERRIRVEFQLEKGRVGKVVARDVRDANKSLEFSVDLVPRKEGAERQ